MRNSEADKAQGKATGNKHHNHDLNCIAVHFLILGNNKSEQQGQSKERSNVTQSVARTRMSMEVNSGMSVIRRKRHKKTV
jgi:hypothetical protein